jgi:hypothetical protein
MTAPGPAWSDEEEELLRSLAAAGESAVAIATLLKRSHHAVRKRAHLLERAEARSGNDLVPTRKRLINSRYRQRSPLAQHERC